MVFDALTVKETTLAGVAFFLNNEVVSDVLRLIPYLLLEFTDWNLHEILVCFLAEVNILLPVVVMPENNRADVIPYTVIYYEMAGFMEKIIDFIIPFYLQPFCGQPLLHSHTFQDYAICFSRLLPGVYLI